MKRFTKPLFHFGFVIVCSAFVASGWFFAEASDKKVRNINNRPLSVMGVPVLTEDFAYSEGALLTNNGWTAHSGGGTNAQTVTSPGLTYSGYAGSGVGNSVAMTTSGEDVNKSFASPVTSGSLYAAFLVNVTASTATGDYFFHFHINGSTFYGKVFVRKDAVNDNYSFGVSRNANAGTGAVYTPSTYTNGTTHLLVVKYAFVDGTGNDTVSLFVDPVPGDPEPAATLDATDFGAADVASIPGVGIRQGSSSAASTQRIDGIRVAATWADAVASSGPTPTPTPQRPNVDMNGDGRTDYVIVRPAGSSAAVTSATGSDSKLPRTRRSRLADRVKRASVAGDTTPAEWWAKYNNASGGFTLNWGLAFIDTFVSADFDGDGKDDVAIWRPDVPGQAAFYSINSSDFTLRYSDFGQENDDPVVVADYDGDGKDDSAVFRCPGDLEPAGQCYFFYRGSLNNPSGGITYVPWGFGNFSDWVPYPGDFNGDGKFDFCIEDIRTDPQSSFWLQTNGTQTAEVIAWGLTTDFVVPGDFDGDGKSDFTVTRDQGGQIVWYTLERDGGVRITNWGISGDIEVPGDYDGDGSTDIAVFRGNTSDATFWIRPSNGGSHFTYNFGFPFDYPLATWYVQ